jgi:hypothetical protein
VDSDKFLVVLSRNPFRALFINSVIHPLKDTEEKRRLQIKTDKSMHPYLTKPDGSWIDCTTIVTSVPTINAITQIAADPSRARDSIKPSERAAILAVVASANTLSPADKKLIQKSLGPRPVQPAAPEQN